MSPTEQHNWFRVLVFTVGFVVVVMRSLVGQGNEEVRARLLTEAPKAWKNISTWAEHLELTRSNFSERQEHREKVDVHLKLS